MTTPTAGPDDRSPTLSDERVAELEVVMTSIVDIVEHDAAMPSMANDARAMVAEIFAALRSAQRRCVSEAFDDARIAAIEARAEADGSADPFGHINALMADIPVLLSALRSARRDVARLDFLEAHPNEEVGRRAIIDRHAFWFVGAIGEGDSLREAIDDAKASSPPILEKNDRGA